MQQSIQQSIKMSSETTVINATQFNPAKDIKFTKPKVNKSGGKSVGVLNSKGGVVMLSTPLIYTWGLNEFVDESSGKKSYDLNIQFPNESYPNEQNSKFLDNILAFQNKIKQDAMNNSLEWFNKPKSKFSAEVADALFHPILKYPKDKNTGEPDVTKAPTMKIKVDFYDGNFNCEIYDMNRTILFPNKKNECATTPMEFIPKGINVALVIKCGGIWFANGKFGCTWKLVQAVVKPKASLKGQCMIQLNSEDAEREYNDESASQSAQSRNSDSVELVNDNEYTNDNEYKKEEKTCAENDYLDESSQQDDTQGSSSSSSSSSTSSSSSVPTFEATTTNVQQDDKKITASVVVKKKVVRKTNFI